MREISEHSHHCNAEKNVIHTFYGCEEIQSFRLSVKAFFSNFISNNIEFGMEDILFGIYKTIYFHTLVSLFMLIVK